MRLNDSFTLDAPLATVAATLMASDYNEAAELKRRDTVVSTFHAQMGPNRFELRSNEHPRSNRGVVDRTRTVPTITRFEWSDADRTLRWTYDGISRDLLTLRGQTRLVAWGERTKVVNEVDLTIHVPVFGRLIEKAIARTMSASFLSQRNLLRRHVAARDLTRAA